MKTQELNIDGLVGPTHNYGGLSHGNIASKQNRGSLSNPRAAALEGLNKMRTLMKMGIPQAVMPPQERPHLPTLRELGFTGSDQQIVEQAGKTAPTLLANLSSASSMWAANAATVTPSADADDGKVHLSPANLISMPHRAIESTGTHAFLKKAFQDDRYFHVHSPLPHGSMFADEGAANHNRLCASHGQAGLEVFVYGRSALDRNAEDLKLPARQTLESTQALARRHTLSPAHSLMVLQGKSAINAGAFHNDVVCVANENVLLFHEQAFEDLEGAQTAIRTKAHALGFEPQFVMAPSSDLSLEDAIKSYFFNSQLITLNDNKMALILPSEAQENMAAKAFGEACVAADNPISQCIYLDLRQSMRNGGGPACLRLRVALNQDQLGAFYQPLLLDEAKIQTLENWVSRHYRDQLGADDLGDPALLDEVQTALDELTQILHLGCFYPFQSYVSTPHI